MNYYKQIAEMLGLELGQEFRIIGSHEKTIDDALFEITEDGLSIKKPTIICVLNRMPEIFTNVLDGDYKVVPKPFKPKCGERYWSYSLKINRTCCNMFGEFIEDYAMWKSGNCFRTEEEAKTKGKEIMEQIMKEYKEA